MRSDLVETFKVVNGKYDINPKLFFQLDEGEKGEDEDEEGNTTKNCLRKDLDWVIGKCFFLIELLIIETYSLPVASTLALLTLSRSTSHLNWNRKL